MWMLCAGCLLQICLWGGSRQILPKPVSLRSMRKHACAKMLMQDVVLKSFSWRCFFWSAKGMRVSPRATEELLNKWLGPFEVSRRVVEVAYELLLHASVSKIHPVFPLQVAVTPWVLRTWHKLSPGLSVRVYVSLSASRFAGAE